MGKKEWGRVKENGARMALPRDPRMCASETSPRQNYPNHSLPIHFHLNTPPESRWARAQG